MVEEKKQAKNAKPPGARAGGGVSEVVCGLPPVRSPLSLAEAAINSSAEVRHEVLFSSFGNENKEPHATQLAEQGMAFFGRQPGVADDIADIRPALGVLLGNDGSENRQHVVIPLEFAY